MKKKTQASILNNKIYYCFENHAIMQPAAIQDGEWLCSCLTIDQECNAIDIHATGHGAATNTNHI